jgi:hypothetical protein
MDALVEIGSKETVDPGTGGGGIRGWRQQMVRERETGETYRRQVPIGSDVVALDDLARLRVLSSACERFEFSKQRACRVVMRTS